MFIQTNIPESTGSLTGRLVEFGEIHIKQECILPQPTALFQALCGNRCGHDPEQLREYHRPPHHKPRPSILEQAIQNAAHYYNAPKKFLKKLGALHPKNRRKRSERREAITSVLQVILHYIELISFKVGMNTTTSEVISLDIHFIADKAGTTPIRARRAIKDLVKAGYIKLSRQWTRKNDGSFVGLPSIREVTLEFFHDLGIDLLRLASVREWKRKKQEKVQGKRARYQLKAMMATASALSASKAANTMASVVSKIFPKKPFVPTIDRALISQALELYRASPERSPGDYLKMLLRKNE